MMFSLFIPNTKYPNALRFNNEEKKGLCFDSYTPDGTATDLSSLVYIEYARW